MLLDSPQNNGVVKAGKIQESNGNVSATAPFAPDQISLYMCYYPDILKFVLFLTLGSHSAVCKAYSWL